MLIHLFFHKQTSLLPICAEVSQIGFDATIKIAFATALAVFSIAQNPKLRFRMEDSYENET